MKRRRRTPGTGTRAGILAALMAAVILCGGCGTAGDGGNTVGSTAEETVYDNPDRYTGE